jgi:hypothetical protein
LNLTITERPIEVLHKSIHRFGSIFVVFSVVLFSFTSASGQELQRAAFTFLNVSTNARVDGLGGVNVSLTDRDVNTFLSNPATVSDTLAGMASFNYQFYVADIGHAAFTYLADIRKAGLIGIGINHFSYGKFDAYDASGNPIADFNASETAIILSKQHEINNFRLGVSIKGAFASLGAFRSSALVADLGGVYAHPDQNWQVGLVIKNAGFMVSDFTQGSDSQLPIDVQIGATIKPQHMPLRFSLTAYRLIESKAVEYNQKQLSSPGALQKVLRHFNFGGEILLHRNINVLLGYNYGIHQELRLQNAGGSSGLSFGFSAMVKGLEFVFSRSTYVSGSAGYTFTLSTNAKRFLRKNKNK